MAVAEYLRRVRARYTESAVRAGTLGLTSTLMAYQLFGQPRLRLHRVGSDSAGSVATPTPHEVVGFMPDTRPRT
jgi:hypothetical protein